MDTFVASNGLHVARNGGCICINADRDRALDAVVAGGHPAMYLLPQEWDALVEFIKQGGMGR